ncbi:MAG: threonylcarbamoyl-AMP synthase [Acidobacteria bacterium]|nr:threonylcarbamoyl-AMP synthase [Acidobacteriota bacterium]MCA1652142.1 threonylcarbamoyl-AMP synthase [Acidobacteriota bacterium]
MLILTVSRELPDRAAVDRAAAILGAGGVVAYPTDTVYGLAADPRRDDAVRKLFAVKRRDALAAIPLIAADLEQARCAGAFGDAEERLARAFWPGPLSVVIHAAPSLSRLLLGGGDTIAVRVPADPVARALASSFGACITATSANVSGRAPATSATEIVDTLSGLVDAVLDAGTIPGGLPSTIVEMGEHGPTLVRAGAIAWDRVLKSLQ